MAKNFYKKSSEKETNKVSYEGRFAKLKREAETIKKQFDDCQNFKRVKGILTDAMRAVEFYEGRQWGDYTGKVHFEKPVINFIQNITDSKAASILQKTYKPVFVVDGDQASTDKVTKFSEWQMKEMDQNDVNRELTYDGLIKGTFIGYYWWDEDAVGTAGITDGSLMLSTVDLEDFAVANPTEKDVQKQAYVIVRSRESVSHVREQCTFLTDEEKKMYINANNLNSIYKDAHEQQGDEITDVYTKFFRQDGEVYFIKCTDTIIFKQATCLNPMKTAMSMEATQKSKEEQEKAKPSSPDDSMYNVDSVNREGFSVNGTPYTEQEQYQNRFKARFYPFTVDSFIKRNKCIFGISFVAQLIPNQKSANVLLTTQLIGASKAAMPTIVVKEGALGTSTLDLTKSGGVITDRSGAGVDGIKVLNVGTLPTQHYELAASLISLTKDTVRANDVLDDGRNIPSGMSGYAINQLMQIQDKPVAQWQNILSRMIVKEARILEMFYKLFYRNTRFSYTLSDAELLRRNANMNGGMPNQNMDLSSMSHSEVDMFDGAEYLDTPFSVTIDVAEGTKYNEVVLTTMLETLFLNGTVEKISPEYLMMWANMIPDTYFPKRREFIALLKQKEQSMITQLQQALEQKDAQLQQAANGLQQLASQNDAMKKEFTGVTQEYNSKLAQLQQVIKYQDGLQNKKDKSTQTVAEA